MDRQTVVHDILEFLTTHLVGKGIPLTGETSLFEGRLLDSIRLVELITFIEKKFSVRVAPLEIVLENFDSADRMATYLVSKLHVPEGREVGQQQPAE